MCNWGGQSAEGGDFLTPGAGPALWEAGRRVSTVIVMSTVRVAALRRAYTSQRTWQATAHAVIGVLAAGLTWLALGLVLLLWWASWWSLLTGPTGDWTLPVLYVLGTVLGPIPVLWCVREFASVQRTRFAAVLGEPIADPRPPGGRWRLVQPWTTAATWRQLAYHLLAIPLGLFGGSLVALSWAGLIAIAAYAPTAGAAAVLLVVPALVLLAIAPWLARGLVAVDVYAARALLGPSSSERLANRVRELTRSREEVIAATDAERRRIERDLHDGAQQRLVSLAMHLGMARNDPAVSGAGRAAVEAAHDQALAALAELREFVRGLHPAVLNDRGLDAALSGIAARAPLPVDLQVDVPVRCEPSIEAIAYFVVSEALTNVARHAEANRAQVRATQRRGRLRVEVRDDGHGGAAVGSGSGLTGLAQRAAAVDGTLSVESPPGGPTTITVELPCA